MNKINLQFLHSILGPLTGTGDDDEAIEKYRGFDSDDEYLVKDVIKKTIKEKFDGMSDGYKKAVKDALAYSLLSPKFDFEDVFDSNLIAFHSPTEPKDFFLWIWEVLFPERAIVLSEDFDSYKTVWDLNDPTLFGKM